MKISLEFEGDVLHHTIVSMLPDELNQLTDCVDSTDSTIRDSTFNILHELKPIDIIERFFLALSDASKNSDPFHYIFWAVHKIDKALHVISESKFIHKGNINGLIVGILLLLHKFGDDFFFYNTHLAKFFGISSKKLNKIEQETFSLLLKSKKKFWL
jgi:hypothetical protein